MRKTPERYVETLAFEKRTNPQHYPFLTRLFPDSGVWKPVNQFDTDLIYEIDGKNYKFELKNDRHWRSKNLFVETHINYSNGQLHHMGWLNYCKADVLSYAFFREGRLVRQLVFKWKKMQEYIEKYSHKFRQSRPVIDGNFKGFGLIVPIESMRKFIIGEETKHDM